MDLSSWTMLVGGVIGVALALLGVRMLVTGRVPAGAARSFPDARTAGLYHLLFGLALAIVVAGVLLPGGATAPITAVIGVLLVLAAVVKYRPRKPAEEQKYRPRRPAGEENSTAKGNSSGDRSDRRPGDGS